MQCKHIMMELKRAFILNYEDLKHRQMIVAHQVKDMVDKEATMQQLKKHSRCQEKIKTKDLQM